MKNRLKELRHKHGVSQAALAEAVGTSRRTVFAIEVENKDLHVSLARKLASHFGCGMDDMFIFEDGGHTAADKAMWYAYVVSYTAELLGETMYDTAKMLEHSGLAASIIEGYDVWHTQGYEYMAEMLTDELSELQE